MKADTTTLCPTCDTGHLHAKSINYTTAADGVEVTIPDLLVEVCDHCGEIVVSADAADIIDNAVADQTEQLTVRELERIREDFGVDQTVMSEILGLGGKTYHRWERGNQIPSRSMGYYLRTLAEFPLALDYLRTRGWRRKNRIASLPVTFDSDNAFPSLTPNEREQFVRVAPSGNPAKALFGRSK